MLSFALMCVSLFSLTFWPRNNIEQIDHVTDIDRWTSFSRSRPILTDRLFRRYCHVDQFFCPSACARAQAGHHTVRPAAELRRRPIGADCTQKAAHRVAKGRCAYSAATVAAAAAMIGAFGLRNGYRTNERTVRAEN
jgi:hypothetical protein